MRMRKTEEGGYERQYVDLLEVVKLTIPVNLLFIDGKLYLPIQSDVENIALETLDDDRRIYFDPIPLIDNLYLKYDRKSNCGWEVLVKKEED